MKKNKLIPSAIGFGCLLLVNPLAANASVLSWNGGTTGTWDTGVTANWLSGGSAAAWTAGDIAQFGAGNGTTGTYNITLGAPVTITSGTAYGTTANWTIEGSTLNFTPSQSGGTAYYFYNYTNTTINSVLNLSHGALTPGTGNLAVQSGSLTLGGGGVLGEGMNFTTSGGGALIFKAGTYTHAGAAYTNNFNNSNIEIKAAEVNVAGVINVGINTGATVTKLTDANAKLTSGNNIIIGSYSATTQGTLLVQAGTVTSSNIQVAGSGGANAGKGTLDVQGGAVTTGTIFANYGATGSTSSGTVKISGGTVNAASIRFGQTGAFLAGSSATFLMTGGTLNLGAGGIANGAGTGTLAKSITLSGGTIAATADWSSGMDMALDTVNGDITFKAADASDVAHNITLSGALSGNGGLIKKGTGALTLAGANTYVGATTVNSGTLTLASTGSIGTSSTIVVGDTGSTGAVLDVTAKSGFTIGASQALKGIGTVKGATTVVGTLAPGNSIGTISMGDLTLESSSMFAVELGRDGTGAISDRTNVVGSVGIISGADLTLTLYTGLTTPQVDDVFYLINNDGTDGITGEFTKLNGGATTLSEGSNFTWNDQQWVITYKADAGVSFTGGNDVAIMAVVPEPNTWAMIVGGIGVLAFGSRIRRRATI